MYSYITSELPDTVFENFKQIDSERVSIFGHSMGGHGALTLVSSPLSTLPSLLLHVNKRAEVDKESVVIEKGVVFEEPGEIQVCLRLRAHRQSLQLPLGPESVFRVSER